MKQEGDPQTAVNGGMQTKRRHTSLAFVSTVNWPPTVRSLESSGEMGKELGSGRSCKEQVRRDLWVIYICISSTYMTLRKSNGTRESNRESQQFLKSFVQ